MSSEALRQADAKAKTKIATLLPQVARKSVGGRELSQEEQARVDALVESLETALVPPSQD